VKKGQGVGPMFDHERLERYADWRPSEPPSLHNVENIIIDYETTGLRWWDKDVPGGVAYCLDDGTTGYLPWAHPGGQNLPRERVIQWLHDLKNVHITNIHTKFEVHMSQAIDVNLEEQGCTVSDVAHWAALLDDHRRRFSLEELCKDYLPEERKVLAVDGETLDGSKMMEYPAGMVAVRAIGDVRQVHELMKVLGPQIETQDLTRVRQLEDDVIFPVCEMERNALPIDVPLLRSWFVESEQRLLRYLWQIHRETGLKFNPSSSKSWGELFKKLGIEWNETTATGQVDTTDVLIKRITHPIVQLARKASKLADLKADYIDKYHHTVGDDGKLRFALHQLRGDEGGTITGRFSGAAIKIGSEKIGCNPQQIPDANKQVEKGHDTEFIIRKLIKTTVSADAKQIEYRLFADYARNPKVLDAYVKDPNLSFHKLIHGMLLPHKPDLSYEHQKNINFMKVYAGGLVKLAMMLDYITPHQAAMLRQQYHPKAPPKDHPLLAQANLVNEIYARELPEVGPLLRRASHIAMTKCSKWCNTHDELHRLYQHKGFVTTLTGRRSRFPNDERLHKALNAVIQGGAADIMKMKMVEVHRARKRIGFTPCCTNHDEIIGLKESDETPRLLAELLNEQSFPQLKVPILWDTKTGATWADC
jgi:DNA polymerase-1